ncbi:MAG: glycosyltransferase family 4 protein [Candidatus Omnitrophota bacterium]|nr:MAG: glycosyltransferase family 4 protein [Candidatus Omnitrophota bacterium]
MSIVQVFYSRITKHGSFEDFMIELARQSKERGMTLSFVFPNMKTQAVKDTLERFDAKVYVVSTRWESFLFLGKVLKIIKRQDADTVDFHFCSSLNFILLFLILRIMRKKVIFHYHGEIKPLEELGFFNHHFSRLRLLTFFVNRVVCVSGANKRYLEALNIRKSIDVIYNGINIENFTHTHIERDFRKEFGFTNGERIVTAMGSLIPRKGIDVLLRAARLTMDCKPDVRFVFIGGGDKAKYEKLAKDLGIEGKVYFTGLIKEYPYYILRASDVYVSASFAESFGLSIAEAQVLGLPVVATSVGGVPEVVDGGRTGLLVASGDDSALAEAIVRLLEDEDLQEYLCREAAVYVRAKFNIQEKVKELIDVCFS